jgi:acyl-CoA dehydrogenase
LEFWLQGLVDNKTLTIEDRENWLRLNDLVLEALKVDDYESFDK